MWAYHDSRDPLYRNPFGAAPVGGTVVLRLDVGGDAGASATLRTWIDGVGEGFAPMEPERLGDRTRFSCSYECGRAAILWYSFLIERSDGRVVHYGAREGRTGGEGTLSEWQPASFQLTIYEPREVKPTWFTSGIVYQVFPDRYRRGADWRELAEAAGGLHCNDSEDGLPGTRRRVVERWDTEPAYERDAAGRVTTWDFYGGTLSGICDDLARLSDMGITTLYLNPIFEARSSHRYDTADFLSVDAMLGDERGFRMLCDEASKLGISIVLDGVFDHVGADSRYFNRYGTYPDTGAYQSPDSPYRDWYEFSEWPDRYASWWGIPILPKLNHKNDVCRSFFTGVDGVGARYIRRGIAGWRLDVADELSDDFLDEFHASVRAAGAESARKPVIIGEVWENAAEKTAYGRRRRYLQGGQLDSVMNYPVRSGILAFVCDRDAEMLYDVLTELYASYPRPVSDSLMNLIGTHDTERILTVLGSEPGDYDRSNRALSVARLSPEKRRAAAHLLKLASLLQYTVFGIPSLYYGDEVGLEGYHDPFCRMPFPWDELEEPVRADLLAHYRALGALRAHPALNRGGFLPVGHGADWLAFRRSAERGCAGSGNAGDLLIAVSRSSEPVNLDVPQGAALLLAVGGVSLASGCLTLSPDSGCAVRLG